MSYAISFTIVFVGFLVVSFIFETSREKLRDYPTADNLYKEFGQILNKVFERGFLAFIAIGFIAIVIFIVCFAIFLIIDKVF